MSVKTRVALFATALGLAALPVIAAPAAAAPAHPAASATEYHIVNLDSQQRPVKDQIVSKQTYEKSRDQARRQAARSTTGRTVRPNINRVPDQDCKNRSDFFKLWNNTTIANGVCFANAGSVNINVYNVYEVTTGNNVGDFHAAPNARFPGSGEYNKWVRVTFQVNGHPVSLRDVTNVHIV